MKKNQAGIDSARDVISNSIKQIGGTILKPTFYVYNTPFLLKFEANGCLSVIQSIDIPRSFIGQTGAIQSLQSASTWERQKLARDHKTVNAAHKCPGLSQDSIKFEMSAQEPLKQTVRV